MTTPTIRHRARRTPRQRRLRIALISSVSVLVVAAVVVGGYVASLSAKIDSTQKIVEAFPDEKYRPAPTKTEAQNILLLGSDSRGSIGGSLDTAGGSRADTIMVVHIGSAGKSVHVMSIMRDSWVDIPGRGESKINAALAYGGVPLMVQTIEGLINSRIDRVAMVDFEGFEGLTDALGGVPVNNPTEFRTKWHTFVQGPQTLNGEQALIFVRERHAFRDGDYTRVRNQQLFIKSVMDKTLSRETLTNPAKVSNLLGSMTPYMAVDEGLNSAYAAKLGLQLSSIRSSDVTFFTIPNLGTGTVGGQSVVKVDFAELETLKKHFADDTMAEYQVKAPPS